MKLALVSVHSLFKKTFASGLSLIPHPDSPQVEREIVLFWQPEGDGARVDPEPHASTPIFSPSEQEGWR